MARNRQSLTKGNLDRLTEFLNQELEQPKLAARIPSGAHLFYGSYNDTRLTKNNLRLATRILLGMTLGYVEAAPLIMVFEYKPGKETVIDLSSAVHKRKAKRLVETFREQSQQELVLEINDLNGDRN